MIKKKNLPSQLKLKLHNHLILKLSKTITIGVFDTLEKFNEIVVYLMKSG